MNIEKKEDRYEHTFKRNEELEGALDDFTLSEIHEGDYVIINTSERVNISSGYVREMNRDSLTILLDRFVNLKKRKLLFFAIYVFLIE